jgi:hypothetical protein
VKFGKETIVVGSRYRQDSQQSVTFDNSIAFSWVSAKHAQSRYFALLFGETERSGYTVSRNIIG